MKKTILGAIAATGSIIGVTLFGLSATAQTLRFGTNGIQFAENTWIEFKFKENGGWFDSTLAIYEVLSNGSTSKIKDLVGEELESTGSFTFLANKTYTLGLTNYNPRTGDRIGRTIYSTTSLNWAYRNGGVGYQQAIFAQADEFPELREGVPLPNPWEYTSANPLIGQGAKIGFEDTGTAFAGSDRDYNDFVVWAAPEPFSIGGIALGAAGLALARRRRQAD